MVARVGRRRHDPVRARVMSGVVFPVDSDARSVRADRRITMIVCLVAQWSRTSGRYMANGHLVAK